MDASLNPFSPSAGARPPELAGRDKEVADAAIAIARTANGLHSRSAIFVGLRGVGKTVLLNKIKNDAEAAGNKTVEVEADEKKSITAALAPGLLSVMLSLSTRASAKEAAKKALGTVRNFMSALKLEFGDFGFSVSSGEPMTGNLALDLTALFLDVGRAAKEEGCAVVILIDEIQYLTAEEFAPLIQALHKVSQNGLPVILFGAGLSDLIERAGEAKSYAERLFTFPPLGALTEEAARAALEKPVAKFQCSFMEPAIAEILKRTRCYPFFLQEWGSQCWEIASTSPIGVEVAAAASLVSITKLDNDLFRVRYNRATPKERDYMVALASLGTGRKPSGDIATKMGKTVQHVAPLRHSLIQKGLIYAPEHGQTEFTVPLFDDFMRRHSIAP
jgi:hypothetical protein